MRAPPLRVRGRLLEVGGCLLALSGCLLEARERLLDASGRPLPVGGCLLGFRLPIQRERLLGAGRHPPRMEGYLPSPSGYSLCSSKPVD